ncbi:DSC E3 ubiquitin ligase complex subunit 3 [Escovopsis weberi]|uniref:DSC E3 ubiquitin ligase complex subunit 3 n=1 Tax=Escovopsis weberi TaxID=150374 RepID=A0A0M8MZX7_ESCWE|nr:DSC E3 ubiquitin ligase complex subunit 3 [Escovopsis weberi]
MTPPPPYHLTIRFSTLYPDLDLDIPSPQSTTPISLKHLIRTRLATRSRLRFIYHGRLLPDSSALSSVIKPPPPPPPASSLPSSSSSSAAAAAALKKESKARDKGKARATDGRGSEIVRIYINCSIGDELSPQDLAAEKAAAERPPDEPAHPATPNGSASPPPNRGSRWQQARPRGFDRLLGAGFTPSEISTLRTQFASIQTERFARDALPSPDTMRALEDSWIDSNAGEQIPATGGAGGTPLLEDDLSSISSVLDVLIRGMMIGFFFPLGSMAWLLRSDLWSEKWQIFVGAGVMISLGVGSIMSLFGTR